MYLRSMYLYREIIFMSIIEILVSTRELDKYSQVYEYTILAILASNFGDTHEYYPPVQVCRPQICCIYDGFGSLMTLL